MCENENAENENAENENAENESNGSKIDFDRGTFLFPDSREISLRKY